MSELPKPPPLKLLMIVADWEKNAQISDILKHSHAHMHYQVKAHGTASSENLDLFGLVNTDKALTLCLAPQAMAESLLYEVGDVFSLRKKGKGIAFILPVSSAGASILSLLSDEVKEKITYYLKKVESEVGKVKEESSFNLILSIIQQGYSEELMDVAKEAGATGGTVIHARGLGGEETLNFMGMSVLPEREIVFILTNSANKANIMQAISQKCGMMTEAQGLLFSLPVDNVVWGRE